MTPQDPNAAINRRFDLLRQRQEQAGNKAKQEANEDIKRQAAARGRLGSGMTQKLGMQAQEQIDQQQSANIADVESGREQSLFQQAEADTNRQFAREERIGSQEFAKGERMGSQEFATAERLGAQGFNQAQFDANMRWQEKVFAKQNSQWLDNYNLQKKAQRDASGLATDQLELDRINSEFNRNMATAQFNKPELMDIVWQSSGRNPRTGAYEGAGAMDPGGSMSGYFGSRGATDRRGGAGSGIDTRSNPRRV